MMIHKPAIVLRQVRAAVLLASVLASAGSAAAQERIVELDPGKTTIQFTLGDILHTVHGTFQLKQGSIHFNPAASSLSGDVVVDANSGNSGSNKRDKKMKRDVLESDKYPDISFAPTAIVGGKLLPEGDSQVELKGVFHLHGTGHEITLPMPVHIRGDQLSAQMHFVIPYVAWGLKNPSTLFLRVSDKVTIDITAVGRVTTAPAQQ